MIYDREIHKVVYTSKRGTVSYEPLDWLAAITSHIPNKGAQCVRYYGRYRNKSRGIREKAAAMSKGETVIADMLPAKRSCSKKWAALIKKVYEVDPLVCPRCLHHMRIISIIDQPQIIEKILKHCDLWQPQAHGPQSHTIGMPEFLIQETSFGLFKILFPLQRFSFSGTSSPA